MAMLLIVLLLASGFLFYYYKNNSSTQKTKSTRHSNTLTRQKERLQAIISSGRYWGLKINYPSEAPCCDAVQQLQDKKFPINSVPALPLQNCTQTHCYCKHAGLVERRAPDSPRRQQQNRREAIRFEETSDRRSHNDRRSGIWFHHE